jgi:hypothetical protein
MLEIIIAVRGQAKDWLNVEPRRVTYHVDVPNPNNPEGPWINVYRSEDRDSVATLLEAMGANEDGTVNLVTRCEAEEWPPAA